MSDDREHVAADLTPACREMIARLARQAKERRSRAATDAGPAHGAQEREPHEP
jgi:hypothetical protein